MSNNALEWIAAAVPTVFLAAQILTGKWSGRRGRNLGWALFGVPIVTVGILTERPIAVILGIAAFASPYLVDRLFDGAFRRR